MKDIKISNFKIDARELLTFKVTVKQWDYTQIDAQLLKNSENNWDLLDIEFSWLLKWDIDKFRKWKIQSLAYLMNTYCDKFHIDLEAEKTNLYVRNKVKSRTDLTDAQLDEEIKTYKLWLMQF